MQTDEVRAFRKSLLWWFIGFLFIGAMGSARCVLSQAPSQNFRTGRIKEAKPDTVKQCGRITSPILWSPREGILIFKALLRGKEEEDSLTMKPNPTNPVFSGKWYNFYFFKDSLVRVYPLLKPCPLSQAAE